VDVAATKRILQLVHVVEMTRTRTNRIVKKTVTVAATEGAVRIREEEAVGHPLRVEEGAEKMTGDVEEGGQMTTGDVEDAEGAEETETGAVVAALKTSRAEEEVGETTTRRDKGARNRPMQMNRPRKIMRRRRRRWRRRSRRRKWRRRSRRNVRRRSRR